MPKKRDEGHEETEQVLKELEARITKEYKKAENDLQAKLDDYMRRFKIKDDIKRNAVADGNLDQKEYQQWLIGQIAMGKRWEEMRDTIAEDLTHTAQIAKALAVDQMPDVYAINHNYGTFQVEKSSLVDTSYTLYDRDAAARMFKDTDFYKKPGRKVQKAINEGKQKAWDKKQIQSVMFQGIAQGESVGAIATRICKSTCDSDRKAAIRNARTMTTGIQNAGRVDSYKRAEDMGINLKQQWIATLDGRTRHEHRQLDGMMVDVGGVFTVDGYDIEYPGDPSAAPEMVYNCRCTLIPALEGFDRDMSLRHDDNLEDMSYDEWKESHDSYSDPITKQDDIAESMKRAYNNEYRELSGQNPVYFSHDAKGYAEDNFDRKTSVMDSNEDLTIVNPNYTPGRNGEWENNCQRCVPTYLLRRQGFDVTAAPENYGDDPVKEIVLKRASHMIYKDKKGQNPIPILTSGSDTFGKNEITEYVEKLPDGAFCQVSCVWENGGAHFFLAEKKDGAVRFVDPQTGDNDVSRYFSLMKRGHTTFFRIDNTTISDEYLPVICTNKGG